MWFRLRWSLVTYERHTRALRVPVGDIRREVLRTCPGTLLQRSRQCSGKRRHHRRDDVVQSEREVTVSAQLQVSSTVSTVSRCTRQLWTATCPQCYYWPTTRFLNTSHFPNRLKQLETVEPVGWPHMPNFNFCGRKGRKGKRGKRIEDREGMDEGRAVNWTGRKERGRAAYVRGRKTSCVNIFSLIPQFVDCLSIMRLIECAKLLRQ